ncbi:casein kinase [Ceratobasidium sp. AG-Ba]|nr:casein kinase [Ceratobasidium sp. AG-Ba]
MSQVTQSPAVVGQYYQVGKKIGEGSFGVVFEGTNMLNNQTVAIKFEPRKSDAPQLRDEWRSYRMLAGSPGIPQVYHFGAEGLHNVLVIDLFGPNLEDLFDMCGRRFSLKTVCLAARQMITRVQTIHEKNLIYRDIKPDNFLIGLPGTRTANVVHMIDFGMAKLWRDPKTKQHIPYRERKSLSGTARYMSINTHLGREQSRRDDLEGLGHVFMYFLRGGLPWQGLKAATNKQKYEKIGEKKQTTPVAELCAGFPEETAIFMNYVRKLGFEETPDYDFLRELFTKMLKDAGEVDDGVFDWMLLNGGKGWEASAGHKHSSSARQGAGGHRNHHRSRQQPGSQPVTPSQPQPARTNNRLSQIQQQSAQTPIGSNVAMVGAPPPGTPTRRTTGGAMQVIERAGSPVVQHPYASAERTSTALDGGASGRTPRPAPPADAFHPPGAGGGYVRSSVVQGGVGMGGVGANAPATPAAYSATSPHPYASQFNNQGTATNLGGLMAPTPGAQSRPESSVHIQGPTVEQQVMRHQQMNGDMEPEKKKGGFGKFLDVLLCRAV